jgi:cysteinyl-tRNA synthetase
VKRQQEWDSPWGRGFPGWHIECSAMSTKYLGRQFDIHTGGVDHIGVHHTNEIAQSESAFCVHPWVNFWVHNEFLDLGGEKMSKSTGRLLVVQDLVDRGFDPLAFRYFLFQAHYRQQQAFTYDALGAAATAYRRLVAHAVRAREAGGTVDAERIEPYRRRFWQAMADDLNGPQALAVASQVARSTELSAPDRWDLLADFDRVLGFGLADAADPDSVDEATGTDELIDGRVAERELARQRKDFATADRIRDELAAEGVVLVDTPTGATWRRG